MHYSLKRSWLSLLLYTALTVLMTLPLVIQLGTHIPAAEGSDVWVHEWTFWWIERALLTFQNPFYTDLLFHPTGVSLTTHNIAWFNIGLWFPLQAALGNTVAYSLTYIVVFTLNGFCMYLLAFGWTRSRPAAIVAGIIYGFWPYTFTQSGHPNMATIMWPPLALYYLQRVAVGAGGDRKQRWRDSLLAALFIALTGIARWQLLLVVSLLFGLYLFYLIVTTKAALVDRARMTVRLGLPFGFAGLLMLPLGGPVIYTQLTQDFPEDVLVHEPWFGSPLFTYFLPNSRLGLYQSLVSQLPESLQFHYQRVDFLGYTVLLLALIGLFGRWRRTAFWLLIALVYWILALGPELALAYERLPEIPMPYRWVEDFSLIRIVRRPHRFNTFVALPLGLMAAYGVTVLLKNRWFKQGAWAITVLLCLLILGEYRPSPYGLESTYIPPWYQQLAKDPDDFAIFGLPPSLRLADKYFMHYQILHEKPMVEGHISRPTHTTFGFMDQSDFLWHLRIHRSMKDELMAVSHQLQLLVDANVRYLILHKYLLTDEQLVQFIDWLTYQPIYEDDEVLVYHADPQIGRDYQVAEWLTNEIGLIRHSYGPDQIRQGELFHVDARWGSRVQPSRDQPSEDYSACISLREAANNRAPAQQNCFVIGGEWPTSSWDGSDVARGDYTLRIDPLLAPGAYNVTLDLVLTKQLDEQPDEQSALIDKDIAQISLGPLVVDARERVFATPVPANLADLQWADQVRLHGFDAKRSNNEGRNLVQVTLVWQALQRMDRSYKVFVHVVDEGTGALVAQNDFVPRQWSYPTTWWEAEEYVEDTVELTLESEPAGALRILVGLYDEETGERLSVSGTDGLLHPDDAAVLVVLK